MVGRLSSTSGGAGRFRNLKRAHVAMSLATRMSTVTRDKKDALLH